MSIIGWLLSGLIAGALARLIVPGRDPMGWLGTILLGLCGSFVGGLLANVLFDDEAVGLFGSVVGAVIVLFAYNVLRRNRGYARSWGDTSPYANPRAADAP